MAAVRSRQAVPTPFEIHNEESEADDSDVEPDHCRQRIQRRAPAPRSSQCDSGSDASEESDGYVDGIVQEDMDKFQETFSGIKDRFRLINRIGEGTFSTVYKAEDLLYDHFDNSWDIEEREGGRWKSSPPDRSPMQVKILDRHNRPRRKPKFVAIKKIYVTSSPIRILNELDLLNDLQGCSAVCPLITAFRHTDQVVAVLPYFRHTDFREYFRQMTIPDIKVYFRSLFTALAAVHKAGILHRDIKPTNFLYEPDKRRGVLVDFGLAEREGTDCKPCLCSEPQPERRRRIHASIAATSGPATGYPKNDSRPSKRANRAGTRGFRAPEVLFKCTDQTSKIDIWSAGVILLTILSKRFPFFNSADDVEAMIEIATIFGVKRMRQCSLLHGTVFESSIPTIGNIGFSLEKIILWSTCRSDNNKSANDAAMTDEERLAVRFLERCLELDPNKRISAEEALKHVFLRDGEPLSESDDDVGMS